MNKLLPAWSLIYTRPNHEKKVAAQLMENDLKFLLPITRVIKKWHDRTKVIEMPLFPSYIFVHMKSMSDYYKCMELEGFCSYVKFGNQLAIVSPKVISEIDLIVRKGENVEVSPMNLSQGEKVIITTGPLCGLSGEIVEYKGKEKICVRVNLLNRVVLTDFSSNMLAPAFSTELQYCNQTDY